MRTARIVLALLAVICLFSMCAPGPNTVEKSPDADGKVAGFWKGIWQGIISPITFIISIFTKNVRFYEVHNNGFWYNLGFVLGAGLLFNGGFFGGRSCKKKKSC